MKKFLITIIILASIVISIAVFFYASIPDLKPTFSTVEIRSDKFNEAIYIKKMVWGLTGDHLVIVISKSSSKEFEPDSQKEIVFYGADYFFYKFVNDTLNLYVRAESSQPKDLKTNIKINQIELTNPQMMDLYKDYGIRGIKKID